MYTSSQNRLFSKTNIVTFTIYFLIALMIGTSGMVAAGTKVAEIKDNQIFGDTEVNLMQDMPTLVDEDSIFFKAFKDKKRVNVLLLGTNQNMADTIMVVSFDYEAKHVDLISIPRDTYYYRQGYSNPAAFKINAIYPVTKEPLETAVAVSEILLGMPLHFYAIIDYDAIKEVVDAMGGVPMNIPFRMKYTDITDKPPLYIDIPAGQQTLDGEHAVQFLRFRQGSRGYPGYPEGDLGRIKAQQEFMKSAFKQAIGFDLLKITKTVVKNVESDVDLGTAVSVVTKGLGVKGDSIETYLMPHTLHDGPPYYVYPDSEGIAEIISTIYSIEPEQTEEPLGSE